MQKITIEAAVSKYPYSRDEIELIFTEYNLRTEKREDSVREFEVVDEDALLRILEIKYPARILGKDEKNMFDKFNNSSFWSMIAAIAACAAAIVAVFTMFDVQKRQSAIMTNDALSKIAERTLDVQIAAVSHEQPSQVTLIYANDIDTRFELLSMLYKDGVVREFNWKNAVRKVCQPLSKKNYYGQKEGVFSETARICADNDW